MNFIKISPTWIFLFKKLRNSQNETTICNCWWFRNPANQLIWQKSQYLQEFYTSQVQDFFHHPYQTVQHVPSSVTCCVVFRTWKYYFLSPYHLYKCPKKLGSKVRISGWFHPQIHPPIHHKVITNITHWSDHLDVQQDIQLPSSPRPRPETDLLPSHLKHTLAHQRDHTSVFGQDRSKGLNRWWGWWDGSILPSLYGDCSKLDIFKQVYEYHENPQAWDILKIVWPHSVEDAWETVWEWCWKYSCIHVISFMQTTTGTHVKPSFLGVVSPILYILGVKTLHFSWALGLQGGWGWETT